MSIISIFLKPVVTMNKYLLIPLLLMTAVFIASADPGTVNVTEWDVPWTDTRPRDPYVDPQGHVWFCGQVGAYIATLDPVSGNFSKIGQSGMRETPGVISGVLTRKAGK